MNITACNNRNHTRRDEFDGNCFDCADAAMGITSPINLEWTPEGGGYCGESANGWIYSISRFDGPVSLSRHNGDGNWQQCGRYESPATAAAAAERLANG